MKQTILKMFDGTRDGPGRILSGALLIRHNEKDAVMPNGRKRHELACEMKTIARDAYDIASSRKEG